MATWAPPAGLLTHISTNTTWLDFKHYWSSDTPPNVAIWLVPRIKRIASRTTVAKDNNFFATYWKFYIAGFRTSYYGKSQIQIFTYQVLDSKYHTCLLAYMHSCIIVYCLLVLYNGQLYTYKSTYFDTYIITYSYTCILFTCILFTIILAHLQICICAYMYTCKHAYLNTSILAHLHIFNFTHLKTWKIVCFHTFILAYMHVSIWSYVHFCIFLFLHTCILHTCKRPYMLIWALAYLHSCKLAYMHIYILAFLHISTLANVHMCIHWHKHISIYKL